MWLAQLRKRWFGTPRAARRSRLRSTSLRQSKRPLLECLEERIVPTGPVTISVASGNVYGAGGLIAAINTANTDGQPTTIVLAKGTYTVTGIDNYDVGSDGTKGANGLPQITGNVTIQGNGSAIERSSASGTPAFRLLDIEKGGNVTLDNLTITGGEEVGDQLSGQSFVTGGGIRNAQGDLTLDGVTLTGNMLVGSTGVNGKAAAGTKPSFPHQGGTGGTGGTAFGGGLYTYGGHVTVINSVITGNSATGGVGGNGGAGINESNHLGSGYGGTGGFGGQAAGGGVFASAGTLTVNDSQINGNFVTGGAGGIGGAAGLPFPALAAQGNGGNGGNGGNAPGGGDGGGGGNAYGGGLSIYNVTLTVDNSQINDNQNQGGAGGQGSKGGDGAPGAPGATGSAFQQHPGGYGGYGGYGGPGGFGGYGGFTFGGGIFSNTSTLVISHSQIDGNKAVAGAGGRGGQAGVGGNGGAGGLGTAGFTPGGQLFLAGLGQGGHGGHGGHGGNGASGGPGGSAEGGGLFLTHSTLTIMSSSQVSGNSASGGQGGAAGNGTPGGAAGGNHGGQGGKGGLAQALAGGKGGSGGSGGTGGSGGGGGNGGNGQGGGLYLDSSSFSLLYSVISNNTAHGGNGGFGGNGGSGAAGGSGGAYSGSAINNDVGGNGGNGGNGGPGAQGGTGGNAQGAGVYQTGGSLIISSSTVTGNAAAPGNGGPGGNGAVGGAGGNGAPSNLRGSPSIKPFASGSGSSGSSSVPIVPNGGNGGNGGWGGGAPNGGNGGLAQGGGLYLTGGVNALVTTESSISGNSVGNSTGGAAGQGGAGGPGGLGGHAIISGSNGSSGLSFPFPGFQPGSPGQGYAGVDPNISGSVTYITVAPLTSLSAATINAVQGVSTSSVLLATFTQGDATQDASAYTALVDWGDGQLDLSSANNSPISIVVSNQTISVYGSHTYVAGGNYNLSVTLFTNNTESIATPTAAVAANISDEVSVKRNGFRYDFAHHEFVQMVTITNTSGSALVGPLALQLMNLSSNATLANASGGTSSNPYIDFVPLGGQLAAGQSISVTLYFKDPTFKAITYDTQVWQGY